jgi:hypothetical protein
MRQKVGGLGDIEAPIEELSELRLKPSKVVIAVPSFVPHARMRERKTRGPASPNPAWSFVAGA